MVRVALVTGASRGLGARCALEFAKAGYRVAVNYRTELRAAERVMARVTRCGSEAILLRADVGIGREARAMVEEILVHWGRLDVLVNNAGVTHESLVVRTGESEWDRVIRTNLTGVFNCCKAAVWQMLKQRSGHIVNVGSILGVWGARGESAYAASKAGLIGLTKSLAKELGGAGVRCNVVIPGFLPTRMTRLMTREAREKVRSLSALGRFSDLGAAASFIVSLAELESVSGQVFNLDSRIYRWG